MRGDGARYGWRAESGGRAIEKAGGAIGLLVGAILWSDPAFARSPADSAAAQALFDQAKVLINKGRAVDACPKLEESQRLDPASGTLLNLANCYELTGRLASAWTTYVDTAAASRVSGNQQRASLADERASALAPRLSNLTIRVAPEADAVHIEVTRDGGPVGRPQWDMAVPVDSGDHKVAARAPGCDGWENVVSVHGEGQSYAITVPPLVCAPAVTSNAALPSAPIGTTDATPPEVRAKGLGTQRVFALIAGGVGLVGLGVGTGFALRSKSKHDEANRLCNGQAACPTQEGVSAGNDAQSAGDIATAGMIVGAVALAGGIVLWVTAPATNRSPSAQLEVSPSSIRLRGAF